MNGFSIPGRWLFSRSYRRALDEYRRTRSQLRCQRDLIDDSAAEAIASSLEELRAALRKPASTAEIRERHQALHELAYADLQDPRRHRIKDGVEALLTAVVLVLACRAFFIHPMEVPTGSMQPTLEGVHIQNLLRQRDATLPGWWRRLYERVVLGRNYYHIVARGPGRLVDAEPPAAPNALLGWLPSVRQQRFQVGEHEYSVLLPRLELPNPFNIPAKYLFLFHAGIDPDHEYRPGDDLVKMAVTAGDYLLVDKFAINFRRPRRGEIVIFRSDDLPAAGERSHYVKRLIALGGERVQIGDDRRVRINGTPLDSRTPGLAKVYGFEGQATDGQYSGHINDRYARRWLRFRPGFLAPLFPSGDVEHRVKADCLFVLGDNTVASFDSRRFGDLKRSAVVGRLLAVVWPWSPRVGVTVE